MESDPIINSNYNRSSSIYFDDVKQVFSVVSKFTGIIDIDKVIEQSLQDIVRLCRVDSGYLYLFINKAAMKNTAFICARGQVRAYCNSETKDLNDIWLALKKNLSQGDTLQLHKDKAKGIDFFTHSQIQSLLALPINLQQEPIGFVAVAEHNYVSKWDDNQVELLRIFSKVLSSALEVKELEINLNNNTQKYKELFQSAGDAIFLHEIEENGLPGKFIEVNDAACKNWGYTSEELLNMSPLDLKTETDLDQVEHNIDILKNNNHFTFETYDVKKNGERFPIEINCHVFTLNNKRVLLSIARDITERKLSEEKLRLANQKLLDIIDFLPDPTFVIDENSKVTAWNRALEQLTGVSKDAVLGKGNEFYSIAFYPQPRPCLIDYVNKAQRDFPSDYDNLKISGSTLQAETYIASLRGKPSHLSITASPLFDTEGKVVGAIQSVRDISDTKNMEEKLKFLSHRDSLTGLYNRRYFDEALSRLYIDPADSVGIIVCDVDDLKATNDLMGHDCGDKLIILAANIIAQSTGDLIVSRLGGDEFAVLFINTPREHIEKCCNKINEDIYKYNLSSPEVPLSISIGYSYSDGNKCVREVFKEADNAMYRQKHSSKQNTRNDITNAFVTLLEARDICTKDHSQRLESILTNIARSIGLGEQSVDRLLGLAVFHDIGKVGIPDSILLKPGKLTDEEFKAIQKHCEIGYNVAKAASQLYPLAELLLKHHEWWNGKGYPLGLKGEEIPIECRILSIADAYDAMTNDRPYRKALSHNEAIAELQKCAGTQFDPYLVPKFIAALEQSKAV